jgi:sporulation protein YlmC with PRC-barrel domain
MTAATQDAGTAVPGNGGAAILRDPDHVSRGPGPFVMDAATLDGDSVVNSAGEDIGKIEAIMLDVAAGRIAYAVLSFGGFFGIGSKLFAIPWSALTLDAPEKRFLLDISKERLESAPGFDEDQWPSMADRRWASDVHAYYDVNPYWDDDDGMARSSSTASAERYPPLP